MCIRDREREVKEVLIAIPSAKKFELNRIVSSIGEQTIKVRVLPGVEELAQGKISVSDLKTLDITDLLGRDATVPLQELLVKNIKFKNFLSSQKFVNLTGDISEKEGHHPDISFGWGYAKIKIFTHKIKGLVESDFILAAKINKI